MKQNVEHESSMNYLSEFDYTSLTIFVSISYCLFTVTSTSFIDCFSSLPSATLLLSFVLMSFLSFLSSYHFTSSIFWYTTIITHTHTVSIILTLHI